MPYDKLRDASGNELEQPSNIKPEVDQHQAVAPIVEGLEQIVCRADAAFSSFISIFVELSEQMYAYKWQKPAVFQWLTAQIDLQGDGIGRYEEFWVVCVTPIIEEPLDVVDLRAMLSWAASDFAAEKIAAMYQSVYLQEELGNHTSLAFSDDIVFGGLIEQRIRTFL